MFVLMSSSCFLSRLINTDWRKHMLRVNKGRRFFFHYSRVSSNSEGLLINFIRCILSGSLLGQS